MLTHLFYLFVLALPVACISWTITHEDIFKEFREWCKAHSRSHPSLFIRKVCYLFTCEYCFSHWVTLVLLLVVPFELVVGGLVGNILALFAIVWVANIYMSFYFLLRKVLRRLDYI